MTTLLEIKPYILEFIAENLDSSFANKVYWIGERKNIPSYPYCLLSVIAENKDKRTSHHQGNTKIVSYTGSNNYQEFRESITTRYKTCTITVGIYNAWVEDTYDTDDMDEAKEFAYEQIDNLEGVFEDYPINNKFSVQNISPIRPLHEVVDGGYMYRYEFDLTIGYNEPKVVDKNLGNSIEVAIIDTNEPDTTIQNGSVYIDGQDAIANDLDKDYFKEEFTVTVGSNDNIIVETT